MKLTLRAEVYALLAAAVNGTIGPFNRYAFQAGADYRQVAFLKCFGAFVVLLAFCLCHAPSRHRLAGLMRRAPVFAFLALLGVFSLYFFETWAFVTVSIPLVSFLTYAAGGVTLMLSVFVLGERLTFAKITAFMAILGGVAVIFLFEGAVSGSISGIVLALLAGLGYALFLFFSKKFAIGSGLPQLVWLFGFGSLYLAIPALQGPHEWPPVQALWPIAALILVPCIGGFWCTTRAVSGGNVSHVQIIETGDPLFASLFALVLFGEALAPLGWLGGAMILGGLLLALRPDRAFGAAKAA